MGYTFEQRKKAVELYIEYGKDVSAVCSKLGHSSRQAMCDWCAGYVEHDFPLDHRPHRKYIDEQKCTVIYKRKWGFLGMGEIGSFSDFDLSGDPHAAQIRLVGAVMVERRPRTGRPAAVDYGCRGQIESRVAGAGSHGNSRHGSKVV